MDHNYKIVSKNEDITSLINNLHKEELLAIGIIDSGTVEQLFEVLSWFCLNYNHALHVITQADRMAQNNYESSFPDVSFIVFDTASSLAEKINALADTCGTTYFLLTRSDTTLVEFDFNELTGIMSESHPAVLTPLIFNKNKELIPSVRVPRLSSNDIEIMSFLPSKNTDENLYPFLGLGLYDRALFQRLRGYDKEISSTYWQTLDFGTRCWLYGFSIFSVNSMAVHFFSKQFLIEDRSDNASCDRFYTKALTVRFINGRPVIKKAFRTNKRVLASEVRPKIGLYRKDFVSLCENWTIPEELLQH